MLVIGLCSLIEPAAARRRVRGRTGPRSGRRAGRRKDGDRGGRLLKVAVVYRASIVDYDTAVDQFKKSAGYKVFEMNIDGKVGGGQTAEQGAGSYLREQLRRSQPDLVLLVGREALSAYRGAIKDRARKKSTPVIRIMTVLRPRSKNQPTSRDLVAEIPLAPTPKGSIDALAATRPGLRRVFIVASNRDGRWLDRASRHAKRLKIKAHRLAGDDPRKLIARLAKLRWKKTDGVVVAPNPKLVPTPVLRALVRVQLQCKVPVVGFARRHSAAGLVLAGQRSPRETGKAAAAAARRVLSAMSRTRRRRARFRRRRGRRRDREPAARPFRWWYNASAAVRLRIKPKALESLEASPVHPAGGTLTELATPLERYGRPRPGGDTPGRRSSARPRSGVRSRKESRR